MSLLSELKIIITGSSVGLPIETGVFSDIAPSQYCVLTPLNDIFNYSDDKPEDDLQAIRISLFIKENYTTVARAIVTACINADITITYRRYMGHEDDIGYHHYVIDTEKNYTWEE